MRNRTHHDKFTWDIYRTIHLIRETKANEIDFLFKEWDEGLNWNKHGYTRYTFRYLRDFLTYLIDEDHIWDESER
tara:strand:- start:232 stop:456 length:225 start_codon:yes stop_codon:yes gene_type:complete